MIFRHFWDNTLIEAWDTFPLKASLPWDLQNNILLLFLIFIFYLKSKSSRFLVGESKVVFLTREHFPTLTQPSFHFSAKEGPRAAP